MRTTLRRIFAFAAVGVFAAVVVAGPTALAHDRKDGKDDRNRKHERHRDNDRGRKSPVRLYLELKTQVDLLSQQLAALGQLPSPTEIAKLQADMKALTLSVNTMSTQWSSASAQWSSDMTKLRTDLGDLAGRVAVLEAGGGGPALPALFDANEQKVGNIISLGQGGTTPWVAFNEGGHFFALKAVSDHRGAITHRLAGAIVRFTELNCRGQAYLDPYDSNTVITPPLAPFSLALAGVYDNNGLGPVLIYVAPAKASSASVLTQSMVDAEGFCVRSFNGAFSSVPAVMTLESTYKPPYTVR